MDSSEDSANNRGKQLLQKLHDNGGSDFSKISELLAEFRVITREKTLDVEVLSQNCIDSLVEFSAYGQTEAQKCLSNLILNYAHLRDKLVQPYVQCVETRLNKILDNQYVSSGNSTSKRQTCEVLYYDLRIIFLLSALCSASRAKIRDRLINLILRVTERESDELNQDNFLLVIESLKTLFNLTLDKCLDTPLAGDVIKKLFAISSLDVDINEDCETGTKSNPNDQLLVNLIHLLTNMPMEVYLKLSDDDVNKILNHLDNQLKTYSKHSFRDTVLPVLNVCANICKHKEEVRKRWFDEILGSAKEFEKRPEDYDNLRGRLVKLMTSVDLDIKDIAAEFLHALCGGDTEKFITYTGFGNSAAFLSSRGLLGGSRREGSRDGVGTNQEEDDYQRLRDKIDPITGKLETPRRDPMEGLSEEEKEYHAQELAEAITKLANLGVVKPMSINQDGKIAELHPSSLKKD